MLLGNLTVHLHSADFRWVPEGHRVTVRSEGVRQVLPRRVEGLQRLCATIPRTTVSACLHVHLYSLYNTGCINELRSVLVKYFS